MDPAATDYAPRRRIWRFAILLLVAAIVSFVIFKRGSSHRLEDYEAALRARGERLTWAELWPAGFTNEVSSPHKLAALFNTARSLAGGRVTPGLLEPEKLVQPGRALVSWKQLYPAISAVTGTNGPVTWGDFATQMEKNAAGLETLRMMLTDPPSCAGQPSFTNPRVTRDYLAIRTGAQWLMGASVTSLHEGHLEEALQNLEALASMAKVNRNDYTLVSAMIRVAVGRLGLSVTWEALQAPGWSDRQLARLQKMWADLDLLSGLEQAFMGERALSTEVWNTLRRGSAAKARQSIGLAPGAGIISSTATEDLLLIPAYKLTLMDGDQLFGLKFIQSCLESFRQVATNGNWPVARRVLETNFVQLSRVAASPRRYLYPFSMVAIPNLLKAADTGVRAEMDRRLCVTAISLERYRRRHGEYPTSLDALTAELLGQVPIDLMSSQPIRYRRLSEDGTFLIYSVGTDGIDDGGNPAPHTGTNYAVWEGRDAVWPKTQ
jgi:hypothetical protein